MARLQPNKLRVVFLPECGRDAFRVPRCYTLTHSDCTGDIFLTVGEKYNLSQIKGWYTRFMRDEVLGEWKVDEAGPQLLIHCHVSGGGVFGWSSMRMAIFRREMPLVLEAIRYGDREMIEKHPELDVAPIQVHFHTSKPQHERLERWGTLSEYRIIWHD